MEHGGRLTDQAQSHLGDRQEEFEQEVLPHMETLHRYALRLTLNSSKAEDLLQETVMRAHRFFDRFETGTNIKAWLFKIMKNLFINMYRSSQRAGISVPLQDSEGNPWDLPGSTDVEEELMSQVLPDEVEKAVEHLPEIFREAVVLADLEGLSYLEIADALDIPIGTVRSRISRGRSILRRELYAYAKDRGMVHSLRSEDGKDGIK
jgi:RNA polymerase sigma-70 factor (ECF subfamily)